MPSFADVLGGWSGLGTLIAAVDAGKTPATIALAATSILRGPEALYPPEGAGLGSAAPRRIRELATGRWCARRAFEALAHPAQPIPVGPQGAPRWPKDLTGSIAHTEGLVCALVGVGVKAVGVDVERIDRPVCPGVWRRVLVAGEETGALAQNIAAFSAKESFFKMAFPFVGHRFGFQVARVTFGEPGEGFVVTLVETLAPSFEAGRSFEGDYAFFGHYVATWLYT
jgi:4'-phosphopantetheinyl transferase EntD